MKLRMRLLGTLYFVCYNDNRLRGQLKLRFANGVIIYDNGHACV